MPRLSVYAADELYEAVRSHGIAVSAVAQAAVARRANAAWVGRARDHPVRERPIDTLSALADARDEFGV